MSVEEYLRSASKREGMSQVDFVNTVTDAIPEFMYEYFSEKKYIAAAQAYRFYKGKSREICKKSKIISAEIKGPIVLLSQLLAPFDELVQTYIPVNLGLHILEIYDTLPPERDISDEERLNLISGLIKSGDVDTRRVEDVLGEACVGKHNEAVFFVSRTETFIEGACINLYVWGRQTCKYVLVPKSLLVTLKSSKAPTTEGYLNG